MKIYSRKRFAAIVGRDQRSIKAYEKRSGNRPKYTVTGHPYYTDEDICKYLQMEYDPSIVFETNEDTDEELNEESDTAKKGT